MTTDLIPTLTTLLDRWDTLAAEAAQKFKTGDQHQMAGFYLGVMFGMESARDELAAALANAMQEVAITQTTGATTTRSWPYEQVILFTYNSENGSVVLNQIPPEWMSELGGENGVVE